MTHGLGLADPERENALLVGIIEAISAGPELGPLASRVARLIVDATATDVCFVHMLDDSGGSLTLTGATPPFDRQAGRIRLPLGEGISGWVATHREPVVITSGKETDPRYRYLPELSGPDYTSMASVPMATRPGGLVGVLNVHTRVRREFSDRDIRLLTSIGSLVAGAMHQGRLTPAGGQGTGGGTVRRPGDRRPGSRTGRLARDIDDGIMQRLVSITYHLDAAAGAVAAASPFGTGQLAIARDLAGLTLDEGRAAIAGLRPRCSTTSASRTGSPAWPVPSPRSKSRWTWPRAGCPKGPRSRSTGSPRKPCRTSSSTPTRPRRTSGFLRRRARGAVGRRQRLRFRARHRQRHRRRPGRRDLLRPADDGRTRRAHRHGVEVTCHAGLGTTVTAVMPASPRYATGDPVRLA